MGQTIKNLAQLQKAAEKQCYYLADKVADKVKENIEEFIKDYPCDPDGGTLYIELDITDNLLPWNDRIFRLCFSDGKCTLTHEPAEYRLKMEIGTLTTLLLGYKTAERLYALERIEGKQEAVDRLDDVLFHKIPYISDYI